MNKPELIQQLKIHHSNFADYIINLSETDFLFSLNNEKWTSGQQLEHIVMSVIPLVKALSLPTFVLGFVFGKANRSSKTYDELIAKYHSKLQAGGIAPARFSPKKISVKESVQVKNKLLKLVDKLCHQLEKLNESQLDKYILPHPLLGKLTLREMFYFTSYHVQHHLKIAKQNLSKA